VRDLVEHVIVFPQGLAVGEQREDAVQINRDDVSGLCLFVLITLTHYVLYSLINALKYMLDSLHSTLSIICAHKDELKVRFNKWL
jgi:hypothetical protein